MAKGMRFFFGIVIFLMPIFVLADVLPGGAQPEQISRSLTDQQKVEQPKAAGPALFTAPTEKQPPGGAAAKKIKFKLNGIKLKGNHVFSDAQLRVLYQKKLNTTIAVSDLFVIAQDITNYYRNSGYIISRAVLPPQHVKGGVVTIQIIEGFIDKADVGGHPKGARCLIKAYAQKIKECPPLQVKRMEKYILLANQVPGAFVRAVLAPSKATTGAADLTLLTQMQTLSGYMSFDDYGTRYIGPQQLTANVTANSILSAGDSTQVTVTKTTKGKELTYIDANYALAVNAEGVRSLFGGTRARTHPMFVLQPVNINGVNQNFYLYFNIPLITSRMESLSLQLGANYLDTNVTTFNEKLYTDHIRAVGANIAYNFSDKYYGSNLLFFELRQGLPIMGYSQDTNPATAQTSRPGGHAAFSKMDFQFSRLQFIRTNLTLLALVKGQWAWSALLAAEQYTFGGPILGRGYDVAELIGDTGIAGSLELRYDWYLSVFVVQHLQPYIFYEGGEIWNSDTSPTIIRKLSGTVGGIGVRFYFTKLLSGNFMWTQTFTKPVATEELIGNGRKPRMWFSIVASL